MSTPSPAPLIVCAEDDEGHAILIQENLNASGVGLPIEHLHDGQAALDYFSRTPPAALEPRSCVLLLDIRMPKVNGVEVLRQLRQRHGLRLPIIMLTTTDDPQEVARCYELGCSAYVQKPVDYDSFAETVRRIGWFIGLLTRPRASAN
jgi:CheY-like chemotaxis protein